MNRPDWKDLGRCLRVALGDDLPEGPMLVAWHGREDGVWLPKIPPIFRELLEVRCHLADDTGRAYWTGWALKVARDLYGDADIYCKVSGGGWTVWPGRGGRALGVSTRVEIEALIEAIEGAPTRRAP